MKIVQYTPSDRDNIVAKYLQGSSIAELAIQYSADKTKWDSQKPRIRRILVEEGIRLKRGKRPASRITDKPTTDPRISDLLALLQKNTEAMLLTLKSVRELLGVKSPPKEEKVGLFGSA